MIVIILTWITIRQHKITVVRTDERTNDQGAEEKKESSFRKVSSIHKAVQPLTLARVFRSVLNLGSRGINWRLQMRMRYSECFIYRGIRRASRRWPTRKDKILLNKKLITIMLSATGLVSQGRWWMWRTRKRISIKIKKEPDWCSADSSLLNRCVTWLVGGWWGNKKTLSKKDGQMKRKIVANERM